MRLSRYLIHLRHAWQIAPSVLGRNRGRWLASVMTLSMLAAHGGWAADGAGVPVKPTRLEAPPIAFVVPVDASEPVEKSLEIAIDERLREFFPPENPVLWSAEAEQEPLRSVVTDADAVKALPPISLGLDAQQGVQVGIRCEPEPLNRPQRFSLIVRDPQRLNPGVYAGQIVFRVETFSPRDLVVRYFWPFHLYVQGRQVLHVRFSEIDPAAAQPALRVGCPASVTVLFQTVGAEVDLGSGQLELRWKKAPTSALAPEPLLRLPLPFLEEPTDVLLALPRRQTKGCPNPFCGPREWQHEVLWGGPSKPRYERVEHGVKWGLYELETRVPDVFATGALAASVSWERSSQVGAADVRRTETPLIPIHPGLRIEPRHAIVGELITVHLLTASDAGEAIPLAVLDDKGQTVHTLEAIKVGDAEVNPHGGFHYEASLAPNGFGHFQVAVAREADANVLAALGKEPASFAVDFELGIGEQGPLLVFAGAPPFWWKLFYDDAAWTAVRTNAFMFRARDTLRLQDMTLQGVYRLDGPNDSRLLRNAADWNREPELALPGAGGDGRLTVYRPADDKLAADAQPAVPAVLLTCTPVNNVVARGLEVKLDDTGANGERNRLGLRRYVLRFAAACQGADGSPLARVVDVPFQVEVATSTFSYIVFGLCVGAFLVAVFLSRWAWRRLTGTGTPPFPPAAWGGELGGQGGADSDWRPPAEVVGGAKAKRPRKPAKSPESQPAADIAVRPPESEEAPVPTSEESGTDGGKENEFDPGFAPRSGDGDDSEFAPP